VPSFSGAVAAVDKIRFFKGPVPSKAKLHVTIGHATVMAEVCARACALRRFDIRLLLKDAWLSRLVCGPKSKCTSGRVEQGHRSTQ